MNLHSARQREIYSPFFYRQFYKRGVYTMANKCGYRHFTWNDRLLLEGYLKVGIKPYKIAELLGKCKASIYNEIKRGKCIQKNSDWTYEERYSSEVAERKYREHLAAKGREPKIGKDHKFARYVEDKIINNKYSPAAVLGKIRVENISFDTTVCVQTLYNYINKGIFLKLSNKHLPVKGHRKKRPYHHIKAKRKCAGISIEKRPETILDRKEFGHWEMDCVEGAKRTKATFLVLSERKTREEIVIQMKDKTTSSVVKALDKLEKDFGRHLFPKVFKTITVDNGSEFADVDGIERSIFGGKRVQTYYCHPYSSWERGTNENINKMVRRHFPKGTSLKGVSKVKLQEVNEWINNYPRKIFNYRTSQELFDKEISKI